MFEDVRDCFKFALHIYVFWMFQVFAVLVVVCFSLEMLGDLQGFLGSPVHPPNPVGILQGAQKYIRTEVLETLILDQIE